MIMQVHDELIFETSKKSSEEVLQVMKEMMEDAVKLRYTLNSRSCNRRELE